MTVTIMALADGNLAFDAPYNAVAVEQLKWAIPSSDRQWDKCNKRWIVSPEYAETLVKITRLFYGETVKPPTVNKNTAPHPATALFKMLYLGRVKNRGSEQSAYGCIDGGNWGLVFPEQVLREWFGSEKRPGQAPTLYAVLGVKQDAAGTEIKSAWRRLIRQWHPDVCREPDAAQQFQAVQSAYEILSNPATRARYNAGLALEASLRTQTMFSTDVVMVAVAQEYAPPLRCGWVMVEGTQRLGRFVVSKILEWQDITNEAGEILVTSWPEGADMFQERWVRA